MKSKLILILVVIGMLLIGTYGFAFVPRLINYQGVLTDSDDIPLEGSHDLTFKIYPDSLSSIAYWTELHSSVDIEGGLFHVILGRYSQLPDTLFAHGERWIGITVNLDDEMTPKMKMTAVPWAFRAAVAESALVSSGLPVHDHDGRYYTESELNTSGTINQPSNPVDWTKLKNVPAGFADGVDNEGGGSGDGYSLDARDGYPTDVVYVDIFGNVGIDPSNSNNPKASFHVASGKSVLFGADTTSAGAKLMWLPAKRAFRVGFAFGNEWAPDSIGDRSFAAGYSTVASGDFSNAIGYKNRALGWGAVALGRDTEARNDYCTTSGLRSVATSYYATAIGYEPRADGVASVALGDRTLTTNRGATALGTLSEATDDYTTAMGYYARAQGYVSVAMGQNTIASGDLSTAMGQGTTASGFAAVSMGGGTTASGIRAFAAVNGSEATGDASVAMGTNCMASETGAVALGYFNQASGFAATAIGNRTKAESYCSVALGRYNVGGGTPSGLFDTDPVFEIGIGTSDAARANAVTVLNSGNVGIGTTSPFNKLHVDGSVRIGSVETLSDVGGNTLACNSNFVSEVDGQRNLGTASLRWNTVYALNGTINTSDARLKENVDDLDYGLDEIMRLRPVSFSWRDFPAEGIHLGLIAQDVQQVVTEAVKDTERIVAEGPDGPQLSSQPAENLGINYSELIPVLIKAIQEQQSLIEKQTRRIEQLEARIAK